MKVDVELDPQTEQKALKASNVFVSFNNSIGDKIPHYFNFGSVAFNLKPILAVLAGYGLWRLVNR